MTKKKIITIALFLTIIHFIITSLIGHYISVQIGTEIGKIVSDGLIGTSEIKPEETKEETARLYQNIGAKSDEIYKRWEMTQILISLPVRPLITPLLKNLRKQHMHEVIAENMTLVQFRARGLMLDYTVNIINSLLLGFGVYVGLRFLYRKKRYDNERVHSDVPNSGA